MSSKVIAVNFFKSRFICGKLCCIIIIWNYSIHCRYNEKHWRGGTDAPQREKDLKKTTFYQRQKRIVLQTNSFLWVTLMIHPALLVIIGFRVTYDFACYFADQKQSHFSEKMTILTECLVLLTKINWFTLMKKCTGYCELMLLANVDRLAELLSAWRSFSTRQKLWNPLILPICSECVYFSILGESPLFVNPLRRKVMQIIVILLALWRCCAYHRKSGNQSSLPR